MTLDEAFYSKVVATAGLTAIISTRCYPKFVPQTGAFPCIVFDVDLTERGRSFAGTNGLDRATITVGCWQTTDALAKTLGSAFVTAFKDIAKATWGTVKVSRAHVEGDGGQVDQQIGSDGLLKFGRIYDLDVWYFEA